jgi:hypothetical protein
MSWWHERQNGFVRVIVVIARSSWQPDPAHPSVWTAIVWTSSGGCA